MSPTSHPSLSHSGGSASAQAGPFEVAARPAGSVSGAGADPAMVADLLSRAAAGDSEAWRGIVNLYARRVYALARSRLGGPSGGGSRGFGYARTRSADGVLQLSPGQGGGDDAAEEITQSVFVTVAAKLGRGEYTETGRFEAWLFRIAMNRVRDEARRRKRHATLTDDDRTFDEARRPGAGQSASAGLSNGAGTAADQRELFAALRLGMDQLVDADREIIELRHHAGMSFKDIADLLNEPVGTLLARHHRALRKLRELLPDSLRRGFEGRDGPTDDTQKGGAR